MKKENKYEIIGGLIDGDDMFIDVDEMQKWRKKRPLNEYFYGGLVLGFGKNVFVFSKDSIEERRMNE